MTETMTADDAKICRIRASDKTRHDADIFERAEATFHALAKQWAESERLRNALAASQQEVANLKAKNANMWDALAAAREDSARLKAWKDDLNDAMFAANDFGWASDGTFSASYPDMGGAQLMDSYFRAAVRSTDAERTHGETR